jgi:hypothetical protein
LSRSRTSPGCGRFRHPSDSRLERKTLEMQTFFRRPSAVAGGVLVVLYGSFPLSEWEDGDRRGRKGQSAHPSGTQIGSWPRRGNCCHHQEGRKTHNPAGHLKQRTTHLGRTLRARTNQDGEAEMANSRRDQEYLGIDTNVLVAYLDGGHRSHKETTWLADKPIILNPTIAHGA